ncbi:hypothetical protein ARMGADRAFT_1128186 [Armillaria gallica]|uniref:Glycoside hydrolase family 76 protein n=1 Tax=Armillaria gallica TaxID=47427 RepID=A0A2H3DAM1_ARMGA|nr:hypothetical protein ARMGADRAFT_1128186 [Armillaria gallica]
MHLVFIWTLFTLSSYSVAAQDFKPPPTWINPNITQSKEYCLTTASKALKEAIHKINLADGQFHDGRYADAGILYAQMVEFDRLTNQTQYKDKLKDYFKCCRVDEAWLFSRAVRLAIFKEYFLIIDLLMIAAGWAVRNYGYAAARAYTIYGDHNFLAFAEASWASARQYTITLEQAESRTIETKQFTLASSCNTTLAGGTYFLTLYNQLVSCSHLLDSSSHTVWTSIKSNSNQDSSCSKNLEISPCGSGTFIEGLAILAASGIIDDAPTKDLLTSAVHAITSESLWQGADGVYNYDNDHSIGGHCIAQALASIYEHNKTSSDLQAYIKAYISVQYNSVINLPRSLSNPNIYGSPWTGSSSTLFNSITQTLALTVFLGAIQLVDGQSSSSSSVIPASSVGTSLLPQRSPNSSVISTSSGSISLPPQSSPTSSVNPDNSSGPASSAKKDLARIIAATLPEKQQPFSGGWEFFNGNTIHSYTKHGLFRDIRGAASEDPASPRTQIASPENPLPGNRREHTLLEELL